MSNPGKYVIGWLALPLAATLNGLVRDKVYGAVMSRTAAHSISVVPLASVILAWAVVLERRWPLADRREGVRAGTWWLALTLAFEFGLGAARGTPRQEMLAEYNLARGNLWPLVPSTTAVAPELARRFSAGECGSPVASRGR